MPITSIEVEVWTRDEPEAGTHEEVRCTLAFAGIPGLDVRLDEPNVDNFRRGAKETFQITPIPSAIAALSPDAVLGLTIRLARPPGPVIWKTAAVGLRVNGLLVMSRWARNDLPGEEIVADRRGAGLLDGLEVEIHTADIPRGGTDDPVYCGVRLRSGVDIVTDLRLDYEDENDFERGARRRYMLPLSSDLAPTVTADEIERITIRKDGDDGWALGSVALFANGVDVFRNASIDQFLDSSAAVLRQRTWTSDRIVGPVLGGLGADFARIQVRIEQPGSVEARLTPPSGPTLVRTALAAPTAVIEFDGLAADTTYAYELFRAGVAIPNTDGQLRTFPPENQGAAFSFAFGSCVRNKFDTDQPGWEQLRERADELRFFLHLGDTFYFYDDDVLRTGNPGAAKDVWRAMSAAHLSSRLHPKFLRMARRLPTMAVWDDHDFAGNNSIGEAFPHRNAARDIFLSYWANPNLGPTWRSFGLTSRVSIGRVDFYLLDGRFNRKVIGEFFSRGQCDLVLGAIDSRAATLGPRLVVLVSGGPWHSMDQSDSYAQRLLFFPLYAAERTRFFGDLAARVADGRIRGLVLLSGDAHRAEIYEDELASGIVAPELVSSGLAMPRRGTESRPITRERRFSRGVDPKDGSFANFCVVSVDTRDATPNDRWSLRADFRRSDNGEVFFSKSYVLTDNQFMWS
jgi:hypothetical protein